MNQEQDNNLVNVSSMVTGKFMRTGLKAPGHDQNNKVRAEANSRMNFKGHGSTAPYPRAGVPPSSGFRKRFLLLPFMIAALSACATGAKYDNLDLAQNHEPQFQVPLSSQDQSAQKISADDVIVQWWDSLQDEQLSALVQAALQHNNDVGVALANLELARTALRDEELNLGPDVNVGTNVTDQRLANVVGVPGAGSRFTSYEAGFDAAWELDLFGRIRHAVDSASAELEASDANLDDVYVSVAAEVARSYIQLRGAQHRLDVSQRNAANLEQSYQLTQNLLDGGFGDALDVQRALTQWELVKAALPNLQAQIDANINRLSVLTGQMPASLRTNLVTARPLPSIPLAVSVGEPMELLKRRPDIRRAESQLASEVARYKVSVADLYPRVSISGSIGFLATAFADLGSGGTLTHLIGPSISWDAFNRERVHNRVDAQDARVQIQLETFEKTLLTSFEEVDNAMSALTREGESHESLLAAAEASAQASALARQRFEVGSYSFLDVLDAQRTQLNAEDLLARSEIDLSLNLIALYKALGGGWQATEI